MPEEINSYHEIIIDDACLNFIPNEEPPNPVGNFFFDMLKAVETLLVEGDDRHLVLSTCAGLLFIKSENQWTQKSYDDSRSSEELDIVVETYFEEAQNDKTEIEWNSDEDTDEDSNTESDNDSVEDSDT
ncbi:hypothetical protein M9H77_25886 [Catharanthus roseus]|uniref:Uncharacterized protein n=1 Tax=Catharanthus roseus TaxID=4058 RepID=A0ACC0AAR8_CATRO|nr:hypothetical protein M9H77_25886 [Catharanthus roseus]